MTRPHIIDIELVQILPRENLRHCLEKRSSKRLDICRPGSVIVFKNVLVWWTVDKGKPPTNRVIDMADGTVRCIHRTNDREVLRHGK